jgi:cell wall-active antibiotic response 4TMS protein YvqF
MASGPRIPFSGVLLVGFGALFLADQLGAISFGHVFRTWWPALLVLAGVLNLIERPSTAFAPIVMITVGAALLLSHLGYLQFASAWRLWPLVLIAMGLNILVTGGKGRGEK